MKKQQIVDKAQSYSKNALIQKGYIVGFQAACNVVRQKMMVCCNGEFSEEMEELAEVAYMDFGEELEYKNSERSECAILSEFFKEISNMISSGLFEVGKYCSIDTSDSLSLIMPDHVTQTISFTPKKRILFLRLYPIYFQLNKRGCIPGITFNVLENVLYSHTSFLGYIKSRRFKYSERNVPNRQRVVCSSCIALDYTSLSNVLNNNIIF